MYSGTSAISSYSSILGDNELYIGGSFTGIEDYDIYGLAAFSIDTTGPQGSISINLGKEYTISPSVTLTIGATDNSSGIDQMMICNSLEFTGCSWETYSTTKAWTLDSTLGSKTVYVKFKDEVGNISSVYTDTIILHTPSVRITEIGLVKDLADRNPLTVYFTSTTPLVKGVTQPGSTVYFVYDGETYSTVADSSGNFTKVLAVSQGTNTIQYYSIDTSNNQSSTRTLILIVGTEYFPGWLLENLGLNTPVEDEENIDGETPEEEEEEDENQEEEENTEGGIITMLFLDESGTPMVNAFIKINGVEYYTDSKGEIRVLGLDSEKKYKVKIEYNGKKYTEEIMGASNNEGKVVVSISEEDSDQVIDWNKILLYGGIGVVVIFFFFLLFRKRKEKEEFKQF